MTPELDKAAKLQREKRELRRCSNRNSLLLLFFLFFSQLLGTLFLRAVQMIFPLNETVALLLSYAVMFLVVAPLTLLLGNRRQEHTVRRCFSRPAFGWNFILRWTVIGMGVTYTASMIFNSLFLLLQNLLKRSFYTPSLPTTTPAQVVVTAIASMLLAPLFEELIFRGSLLLHTEKFGAWLAIFSSAAAFGLYHQNYQQIFFAAVLGVVSGFLTLRTRSLLPSVFLHFCINTYSVIVSATASKLGTVEQLQDPSALMENSGAIVLLLVLELLFFAVMVVGIVLLVREWKYNRPLFHFTRSRFSLTPGQKAAAYLLAPGTVFTLIVLTAMTVINAMGGLAALIAQVNAG